MSTSTWRKKGNAKKPLSSETVSLTGKKASASSSSSSYSSNRKVSAQPSKSSRPGSNAYRPIQTSENTNTDPMEAPIHATSKHKEHPRRHHHHRRPSSSYHHPSNREGGSIATATISQMDGSASYADMNSIGGWTLDDVKGCFFAGQLEGAELQAKRRANQIQQRL